MLCQKIKLQYWAMAVFGALWRFFQLVKGVREVESGYSGGDTDNPTYKDICT